MIFGKLFGIIFLNLIVDGLGDNRNHITGTTGYLTAGLNGSTIISLYFNFPHFNFPML